MFREKTKAEREERKRKLNPKGVATETQQVSMPPHETNARKLNPWGAATKAKHVARPRRRKTCTKEGQAKVQKGNTHSESRYRTLPPRKGSLVYGPYATKGAREKNQRQMPQKGMPQIMPERAHVKHIPRKGTTIYLKMGTASVKKPAWSKTLAQGERLRGSWSGSLQNGRQLKPSMEQGPLRKEFARQKGGEKKEKKRGNWTQEGLQLEPSMW